VHRAAKRLEDEIEFERAQGELVEKLNSWLLGLDGRRIPPAEKEEAAGLRRVIRLLRERAGKQATLSGLDEIRIHARPEVAKAQELLTRIAQCRVEVERAKEGERNAIAFAAEQQRNRAAELQRRKEEAARRLAVVRRNIGVLEKFYKRSSTKPGERADEQLAALRLRDQMVVVQLEAGVASPVSRPRLMRRSLAPILPDVWRAAFDPRVGFRAAGASCPALAKWGPETRQVLAPALAHAYAEEDRLVAITGRKPRAQRIALAA
jgi:hypothetical protein